MFPAGLALLRLKFRGEFDASRCSRLTAAAEPFSGRGGRDKIEAKQSLA